MKRILVVEDDPVSATMVFDYLTSQGFDVAIVMDGAQAVAKLNALRPDLLLLDISLPNKNGFNIADEVNRVHGGAMPIVMMSAVHKDDHSRDYAMDMLHAAAFVSKPFKLKELLATIRGVLEPDAA